MSDGLVGVVLAAGAGRRLQPLTGLRPKALCPVNNVPLLDRALLSVFPHCSATAVNVHAHRGTMSDHLDTLTRPVHVSVEEPVALGTAGALGKLRRWIDGRHVLVRNADAYLPGGLADLVAGWDGQRCRLLVTPARGRGDFGDMRYVGAALLPWEQVQPLEAAPAGLYERLWQDPDELELVPTDAVAIDCGTPSEYLRANLHASGGQSVVGPGAVVKGEFVRSVAWPGARVGAQERLVEAIRVGNGLTVSAPQPADGGGPSAQVGQRGA